MLFMCLLCSSPFLSRTTLYDCAHMDGDGLLPAQKVVLGVAAGAVATAFVMVPYILWPF